MTIALLYITIVPLRIFCFQRNLFLIYPQLLPIEENHLYDIVLKKVWKKQKSFLEAWYSVKNINFSAFSAATNRAMFLLFCCPLTAASNKKASDQRAMRHRDESFKNGDFCRITASKKVAMRQHYHLFFFVSESKISHFWMLCSFAI